MKADLHTHTTLSDGLNEPSENVRMAKEVELAALAITDHDSVLGIEEAINTAIKFDDIEIVPGIEISTVENGEDVHILGYYIDYKDKKLLQIIDGLQKVRERRNEMMLARLNELGIDISIEEVNAKIRRDGAKVGRPHIAEVLIDKGIIKTMEEAFDQFLGKDGRAYINPIRISPEEGIDIIKNAGGAAVIAHPGIYDNDEMVIRLIKYGLVGIEAYHPDHDEAGERKYQQIADKYNVLATGGSDFHGERGGEIFHSPIGGKSVPYEIVKKLKELSKRRKNK